MSEATDQEPGAPAQPASTSQFGLLGTRRLAPLFDVRERVLALRGTNR